jgi:hypothetical protein
MFPEMLLVDEHCLFCEKSLVDEYNDPDGELCNECFDQESARLGDSEAQDYFELGGES